MISGQIYRVAWMLRLDIDCRVELYIRGLIVQQKVLSIHKLPFVFPLNCVSQAIQFEFDMLGRMIRPIWYFRSSFCLRSLCTGSKNSCNSIRYALEIPPRTPAIHNSAKCVEPKVAPLPNHSHALHFNPIPSTLPNCPLALS